MDTRPVKGTRVEGKGLRVGTVVGFSRNNAHVLWVKWDKNKTATEAQIFDVHPLSDIAVSTITKEPQPPTAPIPPQ